MLETYDQGQKIVLKRNPKWWGFKVDHFKGYSNFERISMRFIKEPTAQLESFKKGDLHYVELTPDQYVKQTDGAPWGSKVFKEQVENSAPKRTSFVAFNINRPLFKDVQVRHALSQLYNREFMVEKFFYNKSLPATGPWYQQNPAADPNTKAVKFDPASAKAKLKAAGWSDTNKDGVLDKMIDGKLTDFRFTITHPGNEWEKYLTIYKEELKKAGIHVQLKQLEWNAFNKTIDDRNFDMVSMAWGGVIEQDPKQIWHSGSIGNGGSNFAGYSNPDVDKMIDIAREELDDKKRRKLLQKVFARIAADHPYIFLLNPRYSFYGYSADMGRVKPTYKYGVGTSTWWLKE
jgi:microcin C transport system substrate-binding protein